VSDVREFVTNYFCLEIERVELFMDVLTRQGVRY
jgi:hypothetical protein